MPNYNVASAHAVAAKAAAEQSWSLIQGLKNLDNSDYRDAATQSLQDTINSAQAALRAMEGPST